MGNFFAYEGKVSIFFRKCTELLMINTLWLICCIPIITIGPATTAMYYTIQKSVLHNRGYVSREYFRSFKENCKQGMIIWSIYLALGMWFVQDVYFFYNQLLAGNNIGILWFLFAVLIVILILLSIYTFAYLARFENTVLKTIKESFIIMFVHLWMNIKLIAILLIVALVGYLNFLFLLIIPASAMFAICRSMERILRKYMSEEDKKLEYSLNLTEEES